MRDAGEHLGRLLLILLAVGCGSSKSPVRNAGGGGAGGVSGSGGASGGADGSAGDDAPADGPAAATVVRTFVYHELTALNPGAALGPVLSADGTTIAFVQNGHTPNHVFALKFDGTGQAEVDTFPSNCDCQARVDISGDGTAIVSSDSVTLRYVHSDGTAAKTLVTLASNEISDFRITADGSKVFFIARRDTSTAGPNSMAIPRGVWVVAPDGSGLKQVTGADAVAPLFNVTADKVFPFSLCGVSLDVSHDGSHVAFGTSVGGVGDEILGVGGDGAGLHKVAATGGTGSQVHVSNDGTTVGYVASATNGPTQLFSIGFDGAGQARMLADASMTSFGDGCEKPSRLTGDGARYFMSDVGLLFSTDGSGILALAPSDYSGDWLVNGSLYGGSVSDDGTRFVAMNGDASGQAQIVSMQMRATAPPLGVSPTIDAVSITPPSLITGGDAGLALVTAKVTATGTLRGIIANFLNAGLRDPKIGYVLLNDAANDGDVTPADGLYSSNRVQAGSDAAAGPRNMRVRVESTVNDRRHATVVEVTGVDVKTPN